MLFSHKSLYFVRLFRLFLWASMQTGMRVFNTYLAVLLVALAVGCKTAEERRLGKLMTTMRLHVASEIRQRITQEPIQVAGVDIYVNSDFFLDERSVDSASVVDSPGGGFRMRLDLNTHGRMALESATVSHPNMHIAVFAQFGTKELDKASWLACPRITGRITDGILEFSPSIDRASAEDIAQGLNNVAKERNKPLTW